MNNVTVFQLYLERCIGQVFDDLPLHFYQVFLGHAISLRSRNP